MKRFMKVCGITALIMVAVGMILGFVISVTKGTAFLNNYLEKVTEGRIRNSVRNWLENRGFEVRDGYISGNFDFDFYDTPDSKELSELEGLNIEDIDIDDISENIDEFEKYNIDEPSMFDSSYEIYRGDVDKMNISEGNVSKLDIDLGGCQFEIRDSGDDSFYIEAENITKLQAYQKGSTLHVKGVHTNRLLTNVWDSHVVLYVPESAFYDEVEIEFGAGTMEAVSLSADKIELEIGAGSLIIHSLEAEKASVAVGVGSMELYDMKVERLDAQVNAGSLLAEGSINDKGEVECNAGTVDLVLDGILGDYDYKLTCSLGTVTLDGKEYSGMDLNKEIQHGAGKSMELECSVGSITVDFR